ncbi:hypothetical protein Bca4012_016316 [Brassica carinata]
MEQMMGSCFGHLFRLPLRRCAFSGKLVHGMLTRQLVTKKRFELWPVFGGMPTRFSLAEFGHVTGLPCGEFEAGYVVDDQTRPKKSDYAYWDILFGGKRDVTIADVAAMVASDKEMPASRKLKLCLIIIVDGVLLATTQYPKPTVKHVKRLANLRSFLSFPWGRESFWWTISSMLPPPRVMGRCDDPEGEFCRKLRQKMLSLAGFPLALQLWAFEAIPGLVKRLGGNDQQDLLSYAGEKLPQHTGLPLSAVLDAEFDPELSVQPMVEVAEDKEEGWGEFDCEINDRKVVYMVEQLKTGHRFEKWAWGGGDSGEPEYVHEVVEKEKEKKRKTRHPGNKEVEGPVLKQRRLSRYFNRKGDGDGGRLAALEVKMEEMSGVVADLKKIVARQGRMLRKRRTIDRKTGKFSRSMLSRQRKSQRNVATGQRRLFDESDAKDSEEEGALDKETDFGGNDSEPEGMKESAIVPLKVAKRGDATKDGHQVYFGSSSNTFYVTEDKDGDVSGDIGIEGAAAACGTYVDLGGLDQLVGAIVHGAEAEGKGGESKGADVEDKCRGQNVPEVEKEKDGKRQTVGDGAAKEDAVNRDEGERERKIGEVEEKEMVAGKKDGSVDKKGEDDEGEAGREDVAAKGERGSPEQQVPATEADDYSRDDEHGLDAADEVMELSDSSPCKRSAKHEPAEREGDLASLLLAKESFTLDKIVPETEDGDFPFFERVLLANPKVLHLNAGKYDLENQFFLDLATAEKWVSTKHMEVLVDYVASRHEERLKERRSFFLPPWFAAHLQGKSRRFNAARANKGKVLVDGRLTGFLTKEGKRWGHEVDRLYAPMIWDENHWVGLCISLVDWRVLVLDPNPGLRDMPAVGILMDPVLKMLPYLVEKVCPPPAEGAYKLDPFNCERMGGVYENTRSGDCGPVSIKFMELHVVGNPHPGMEGLSDALVDIMRKQFAMDVYKDWVVPLYIGG